MDLLNLANNTDRAYESLGGWTFEYADYTNAGMVGPVSKTPEFARMADIVDPYSYISTKRGACSPWPNPHFETVPKMVVNGGNDEFFLPDDNHIWWDDFKNEKHLLHIPNADHPLNFIPPSAAKGVQVFGTALLPFYSAVVQGVPRPTFTWDIAADGQSITVGNFSSLAMPEKVSVWAATTSDGFRDFRLYNCRGGLPGHNCSDGKSAPHVVKYIQSDAEHVSAGTWKGSVPPPPAGQWTSFVVSVQFGLAAGGFHFTTQMSIVPVARPFAPCTAGVNCTRLV